MIDYLCQVAVFITIYGTVACGLNLVSGFGGMFSIAHAVYFSLGAYGYALLVTQQHWARVPAMLAGLVLAGALGAITAFPALRLRGDFLVVASLAIELVGLGVLQNWEEVTRGAQGVFAIPFYHPENTGLPPNLAFALVGLVMLAVATAITVLLVRSPWGRVLIAIREDVTAAVSLGKHVTRTKVTAFGISAAMSAAGGVLFAGFVGYIDPQTFDLHTSISILAIVLIGGAGTIWAPVVGAVIVTGLPELLRTLDLPFDVAAQLELLLDGALLVLFMILRPQGIVAPRSRVPAVAAHPGTGAAPQAAAEGRPTGGRPSADGDPADGAADDAPAGTGTDTPATLAALIPGGPADAGTAPDPGGSTGPVVTADRVVSRRGTRTVLNGLSLSVRAGSVVALIGPNGAGKTTFLDVLTGFLDAESGTVRVAGRDIARMSPERLARHGVIRVFQEQRVFPAMSVLDNTRIGIPMGGRESALAAFDPRRSTREHQRRLDEQALGVLRLVGLERFAHHPAGSLSGGQQRLVTIARALCARPAVLLLDEPCAGVAGPMLDTLRRVVREMAVRQRCAVLVVEHNTEFVAQVADEVAFLDRGETLRTGTPEEVFADHELSRIYFGVEPAPTPPVAARPGTSARPAPSGPGSPGQPGPSGKETP